MCEHVLAMPASDAVRSDLYEWLAIARSELGFPPDQVQYAFEEAIQLDPANERIRQNFRAFEESLEIGEVQAIRVRCRAPRPVSTAMPPPGYARRTRHAKHLYACCPDRLSK